MARVSVSTRGAKRIRAGHLWIYRSDLRDTSEPEGGAVVSVFDDANNFVGQAFYSDRSEIALRFLTTGSDQIDPEWWRRRLLECFSRRPLFNDENNASRLVYAEGDLLPSIIIDVYANNFVLQTLSQGAERIKDELIQIIVEHFAPQSVSERNDARVRELEGLELRNVVRYGTLEDEVEIKQNGLRFLVSPLGGQKTGSFLDQRENYQAAQRWAFGSALDCFSFGGGFALNLAGSCDEVLGIDISSEAVARADQNARLNQINNVRFRAANVFDELRELETAGRRFDTIVLDPPAFTKSRATVKSGARGYKEINLRALKLLNRGGILVTCTCSYHLTEDHFLEIISDAARDARRRLQLIEKRGQATDHPVLAGVPETHYLKCVIARVIE
jgi:23S rRNA (cytosine1962-C5)-methyltransferase